MAIEVGAKVSGKVSGITNFGAFVDLDDNQTGLVHISQISDKYIKDVHDVLAVGDEVTAKVTRIGDDGKIALSIKAAALVNIKIIMKITIIVKIITGIFITNGITISVATMITSVVALAVATITVTNTKTLMTC